MFKEFIKDFLAESREILARLDEDFVAVESNPDDKERLDSIYGGIHTIKGSAGFFAFSNLETLAHAGESLLADITEGNLDIDPAIISPLLAMVDAIREMLDNVENSGSDGENDYSDLMGLLKSLRATPAETTTEMNWDDAEREVTGAFKSPPDEPANAAPAPPEPPPAPPEPTIQEVIAPKVVLPPPPKPAPKIQPVVEKSAAVDRAPHEGPQQSGGTIRVTVSLLDDLVSLIGELVLARNQVMQYGLSLENRTQMASFQQLDQITRELQQAIMKTRMQPIRNIFSKYPRIVRDLAVACKKQVILNLEGQDTELDKSLIEGISAPLTHLVRNAIDHGIESPADRLAAGKPAEGRVTLSAYHEGGHVNIELDDDGKGIDLDKVRSKAVERGILTAAQAAALTESETINLIFDSGFSTAETVSNISGRGMGMDVVRTSLAGIRGTVDVQTVPGNGTTVRIKVPLTLAIIPALVVSCSRQRYAIPQINLQEVVCLQRSQVAESIERIYETPVYRLRGRLLPLLFLSRELGLVSGSDDMEMALSGTGPLQIVVLHLDEHQFGLIVEEIHDTQEIVVKPIGSLVRGEGCFAGATIMDDGRPALILDILRLAQRARVLTDVLDKPIFKVQTDQRVETVAMESLLLFETSDGSRMALPVDSVGRLELLPCNRVERAGNRSIIQYRERILPLVNVLSLLEGDHAPLPTQEGGMLAVVIHNHERGQVGLVVGRIIDIAECPVAALGGPSRRGVIGTRIIQGVATEMVDADALVELSQSHLTLFKPIAVEGVEQHA